MKRQTSKKTTSNSTFTICCEVLQGLKPIALQEIQKSLGHYVSLIPQLSDNAEYIFLRYSGELRSLLQLRTIVAVYLVEQFAIARPRALLGHQNYQHLLQQIKVVLKLHPVGAFSGLRVSAAGENSTMFNALCESLSKDIQLPFKQDDGDLLLRIRLSSLQPDNWEVLIRLTPRPLSTRAWRTFNMQGALNATIAVAMVEMSQPHASDRFLNLMCGSGTLLIERIAQGPAAVIVGVDTHVEALRGVLKNASIGNVAQRILLLDADATHTPFLEETFDVICADLPWGQLTGSHEQNAILYPRFLEETTRIAAHNARLVVLTHEVTLFESVLESYKKYWVLKEVVKVFQGGLHPRIYVLTKSI